MYEIVKNTTMETGQHAFMPDRMALKIIHLPQEKSELHKNLIQKEARIIANLKHENIVSVYDLRWENNVGLIFMDLIEGKPLNDIIKNHTLSFRHKATIYQKILRALAYSHRNKVVHHDIKPGNILVRKNLSPVLCDFGLATFHQQESQSHSNFKFGTPLYMAPEKISGSVRSSRVHQTDLFSVGVLAYELFTGRNPFYAKNKTEVFELIHHHIPPSLIDVNPHVPFMINQTVLKLLQKNPEDRYQTADEVLDDLNESYFKKLKHLLPFLIIIVLLLTLGIFAVFMPLSPLKQNLSRMWGDSAKSWQLSPNTSALFNINQASGWKFYHLPERKPKLITGGMVKKLNDSDVNFISDQYPSMFINSVPLPTSPFYLEMTISESSFDSGMSFGFSPSNTPSHSQEIVWVNLTLSGASSFFSLAYPYPDNVIDQRTFQSKTDNILKIVFFFPDIKIYLNQNLTFTLPMTTLTHFWQPQYFSLIFKAPTVLKSPRIFEMENTLNASTFQFMHRLLQHTDTDGIRSYMSRDPFLIETHQFKDFELLLQCYKTPFPTNETQLDLIQSAKNETASGEVLYCAMKATKGTPGSIITQFNRLKPLQAAVFLNHICKDPELQNADVFEQKLSLLQSILKEAPQFPSHLNFFLSNLIQDRLMFEKLPSTYFKVTSLLKQIDFKIDSSLSHMLKEYTFNHAIYEIEKGNIKEARLLADIIESHFSLNEEDRKYLNIILEAVNFDIQ